MLCYEARESVFCLRFHKARDILLFVFCQVERETVVSFTVRREIVTRRLRPGGGGRAEKRKKKTYALPTVSLEQALYIIPVYLLPTQYH